MAPDDVDAATLQVILEIQIEDLERLRRRSKGKGREGAARADFEVALDLLRAEMATSAAVLKDNAICRSMAVAIWRDRAALDNAEHEERVARRDRELALRLSEQDDEMMDDEEPMDFDLNSNENRSGIQDDEFLDTLAIKYMMPPGNADNDDASTSGQPESSTWAQSRKQSTQPTPIETAECISCGEDHPVTDVVGCLCSHNYCRQCLARLFQASMVDESLFPPRCCSQPIPLEESRNHLSAELVGQFMAKKLEFETPNRTYCHVPGCSAFVPPQFVRADIAACVKCNNKTCAICKGATHAGECPQDEEAQAVLRLADENGWQRCSDCRRVVELQQGCNHITCICGAEFCYKCTAQWKTCDCDVWDEAMLYVRAAAVIGRAGHNHLDHGQREQLVQEEMRNQQENHECEAHEWAIIAGAHNCDGCGCYLPAYIFECVGCRILACRSCRLNRM